MRPTFSRAIEKLRKIMKTKVVNKSMDKLEEDPERIRERFIRWQAITIAQFSLTLAFISALALTIMGADFVLILRVGPTLRLNEKSTIVWPILLLSCIPVFTALALTTRLMDFRLTMRKLSNKLASNRGEPKKAETFLTLDKDAYGKISWWVFFLIWILFVLGILLSVHLFLRCYTSLV
jgi:hypothetical protein